MTYKESELRKKAEEKAAKLPKSLDPMSPQKMQEIIHELQVHQIELEMQNEELRLTQVALDSEKARYFDLYNFAPVGYLTLSEKGLILEANLTAATMLYRARIEIINKPLSSFIFREDQDAYYICRKQLFETGSPKVCDMRMLRNDGSYFWAHITATIVHSGAGVLSCLIIISDSTERRRAENAEKRKLMAEIALAESNRLKNQLEAEKKYLEEEIKLNHNHQNIIGQSNAIKSVLRKIEQISQTNTTVLILGETGTGKELVARAIHDQSNRRNRALIKVNCSALPSNLIESELFGHEKGAFTGANIRRLGRFEVAHGSTLFLDEIGELPLELQTKLLRVLQDGEFERLGSTKTIKADVRIIAATNRNLENEIINGRFREDLFYRLNIFPITVPPLRDRIDDIPLIASFYIKKISRRLGKKIEIIPQYIMDILQNYKWNGNIRELENVLERGIINSSGNELNLVDELESSNNSIQLNPISPTPVPLPNGEGDNNYSLLPFGDRQKSMQEIEREYIIHILEQTKWKVSGKNSASEILGLERSTLRARMRKLGITKL